MCVADRRRQAQASDSELESATDSVTSTTHIDNQVDAIELALTGGQPGEVYFALDEGSAP